MYTDFQFDPIISILIPDHMRKNCWPNLMLFTLATILGIGSAWYVMRYAQFTTNAQQISGWKTLSTPISHPSETEIISPRILYSRAITAVRGLLALSSEETIYFVRYTDKNGVELKANCTYQINGATLPARWWSLTAYANDFFLFDAPNHIFSIDQSRAALDELGQFTASIGPTPLKDTYWIPTIGKESVVLTLRLYQPENDLIHHLNDLKPPEITPVGVCS